MPAEKLTKAAIDSLKPREPRYYVRDGRGLYLVVLENAKRWAGRVTWMGKTIEIGLENIQKSAFRRPEGSTVQAGYSLPLPPGSQQAGHQRIGWHPSLPASLRLSPNHNPYHLWAMITTVAPSRTAGGTGARTAWWGSRRPSGVQAEEPKRARTRAPCRLPKIMRLWPSDRQDRPWWRGSAYTLPDSSGLCRRSSASFRSSNLTSMGLAMWAFIPASRQRLASSA